MLHIPLAVRIVAAAAAVIGLGSIIPASSVLASPNESVVVTGAIGVTSPDALVPILAELDQRGGYVYGGGGGYGYGYGGYNNYSCYCYYQPAYYQPRQCSWHYSYRRGEWVCT